MAETSIGPRIAVTGEAEFKSAMASITNEFKLLGSEMKLAVSQFDRNDKSTEALTAQNEVLGRQIDSQKGRIALLTTQYDKQNDKLATLKTSLDATKAAFAADSAEVAEAQRAYDRQNNAVIALQTQLNGATAGLNNMERTLESNNQQINENSNNLGEFGEKMKAMGAAVAVGIAAIGAAFLGVVVGGVTMSDDLTKALNGVQASTGTADEEMTGMKETMLDIYNSNLGESFEDISKALGEVKRQTEETGEELEGMTKDALIMRDAFEFEVTESVRTVDMMMKQFGVSSDEAFNLIAQGAQAGLDKNGNLLDSINEYSIHFEQLGFDSEEMFNMMANGAKSGVFDIDKLGDAMKEFGIRSKDGSKTSSEGFQALGLDAGKMTEAFAQGGDTAKEAFSKTAQALFEMKDPVAQNAAGVALFGTQWEDVGAKGVAALVSTKGEIDKTKDALQKINDVNYSSLGQSVEGIKRQLLTGIVLPLGEEVLPKMNEFGNYLKTNMPQIIEQIKPVINGFIDSFKILADNMDIIIPVFASVVTGIIAFKTISAVSALITAFQTVTLGAAGAQAIFNIVLLANPIGAVAVLIGALVAAGVALYMNWDIIKVKITELGAYMGSLWIGITSAMSAAWEGIKQFFSQIPGAISNFLDGAINAVNDFGSSIATWVTTEIPLFVNSFMTFLGELPGKIGYALGFALGSIIKFGIDTVSWVVTEVPKIITGIVDFFIELPGKIGTQLAAVLTKISEWGGNVITWIVTEVPKFISKIINFYAELPGKTAIELSNVLTKLKTWALNMLTTVKAEVPKITKSIISYFSELPAVVFDIGKNIVTGMWDGMNSMVEWMGDKVRSFARGILQGMKDALKIKSPSQIMRDEVGVMIGEGVAEGIDNSLNKVKASVSSMNQSIVTEARTLTSSSGDIGSQMASKGVLGGGITIINHIGALVGSNGMNEFADIMSRKIASSYGLGTGGAF